MGVAFFNTISSQARSMSRPSRTYAAQRTGLNQLTASSRNANGFHTWSQRRIWHLSWASTWGKSCSDTVSGT